MRGVAVLCGVVGLLSLAPFAQAQPLTAVLYAGQNIDAGTVTVWNDEDNLYVTYETGGGWSLVETHLEVAADLSDIPQTKSSNPIPGKFESSAEHEPGVTSYTYTIPLNGWMPGMTLYIAAHAVVVQEDGGTIITETAWGDGEDFLGANWATYMTYVIEGPWLPI